jgi:ABC-type lipoprotein release transport system permease subunit
MSPLLGIAYRGQGAVPCAAILALAGLALGACGQTVSTSSFKGEQHEVAQALANLQSHVSTSDESKLCTDDLARAVVARLISARGGCKAVIKDQLGQIDNTNMEVDSIAFGGAGAQRTATASVRSVYGGKTRRSTVRLVKEAGKWKLLSAS